MTHTFTIKNIPQEVITELQSLNQEKYKKITIGDNVGSINHEEFSQILRKSLELGIKLKYNKEKIIENIEYTHSILVEGSEELDFVSEEALENWIKENPRLNWTYKQEVTKNTKINSNPTQKTQKSSNQIKR
jgi:hypothetical protein